MPTFRHDTTVTADRIDVAGHLNNAAYLSIFEEARWAVLAEGGEDAGIVARTGVAPVLLDVRLRFGRELRLGDRITVLTTFRLLGGRRFEVTQRMVDVEGRECASATTRAVFLDLATRKAVPPHPDWLAACGIEEAERVEVPVVQGLGGAFLYADDVDALAAWYTEHLGLQFERWGSARGLELPSADRVPVGRQASTVFALFQADAPLGPIRTGRVNYRVSDLGPLVARLEAAGFAVEQSGDENGRFAWVQDPEGNRVELWEPPREG